MSSDPNRQRPRSSKKRRATQPGTSTPTPPGPATQRVSGGRVGARRGNARPGRSAAIPTAWLAAIAIVVVAVGLGFASGAIRLGSGALAGSPVTPGGSSVNAYGTNCPTAQPPAAPAGQTSVVTIDTPKGAIELTLKADLSPIAVGNFLALASCGFYDNVVFHRVVPSFVIQAGDGQFGRTTAFDAGRAGTGGPGYDLTDETVTTTYQRGTLAMARGRGPNSAGSQFFIVLDDGAQTSLASANTYQILGSVTKGMEVADAIAAAADAEAPSQPVAMTKVTVSSP